MPYREHDAYEQKLCDMADAQVNCYETICQQLLSDRMADYIDSKGVSHEVYLDHILEEYQVEIYEGMNTKDVIEAEAKRIAESIF